MAMRALPGGRGPRERERVALGSGQEVVGVAEAGEAHRVDTPAGGARREHEGRGAVGDGRAVGAAQRLGDDGVAVRDRPAEVLAEVLAQLGVGVEDAVAVVLRGDRAEGVADRAVTLLVVPGDVGEEPGEARRRRASGQLVVRAEQCGAHDVGRGVRHLLGADDEDGPSRAGEERLDALLHGRRARGAGVLDARRRHVREVVADLEGERRREAERPHPRVERAEHDLVDLARLDPGALQGLARRR